MRGPPACCVISTHILNVEGALQGPGLRRVSPWWSPWFEAHTNIGAPSQVYSGYDGSVWAIDRNQEVYKMVSVTFDGYGPNGPMYDCQFVELPQMHGTTSLAVADSHGTGTVYSITSGAA